MADAIGPPADPARAVVHNRTVSERRPETDDSVGNRSRDSSRALDVKDQTC